MSGKFVNLTLKTRHFSICGQLSFSPSLYREKGERKVTGTVRDCQKMRNSSKKHSKNEACDVKLCQIQEKVVLFMMTLSDFKLEVALSQESSAAVQKKEHL